jgi:hypothetical protein
MLNLQKITSEYSDTEDRIRITGEDNQGSSVSLWFTARLLSRLLPHLLDWLTEQTENTIPSAKKILNRDDQASDFLQGFAQQAAISDLSPQSPVQDSSRTLTWLVKEVDIRNTEPAAILLAFKNEQLEEAAIYFQAQELRQWLSILYELWLQTEWPAAFWPSWIVETEQEKDGRIQSTDSMH